ncbi:MAG TPA: hypothetical protein VF338_11665 [Leptolinea sp.]
MTWIVVPILHTFERSFTTQIFPAGIFCHQASMQFLRSSLMAIFAFMPACKYFLLAGVQFLPSGRTAIDSLRRAGKFFPQAAGWNLLPVYSVHFLHYE